MFVARVVGIGDCGSERIAKHGGGLGEGDLVLSEIIGRLASIPLELYMPSVSG